MRQTWTLYIEDFGKIKEGEIQIYPLMLFVGDNNSGKSYLMTLLWGIMALGKSLFPKEVPSSESYKKCDDWLVSKLNENNVLIKLEEQDRFVEWFNDILKNKKRELLEKTFNYSLDAGKILIKNYKREYPLEIRWDRNGNRISRGENYIRVPISKESLSAAERYRILRYLCWCLIMDDLTSSLYFGGNTNIRGGYGEPLYLPASRTGFMLTYKTLIKQSMEQMFMYDEEEAQTYNSRFTLPVFRFLNNLVSLEFDTRNKYSDITQFIEEEIIQGELLKDTAPVPNYTFKPKGLRKDIPLHVTSSLVAELSPVVLFLKSRLNFKTMFIEEPEAHLHPRMQRIIAKAIVRLINKDLNIWLTSHSDTIFQQINNLIKLSNYKNEEKNNASFLRENGYSQLDILDLSKVGAYQFSVMENGKTIIDRLEITNYGFPVPTFNKTIVELAEETLNLQESE